MKIYRIILLLAAVPAAAGIGVVEPVGVARSAVAVTVSPAAVLSAEPPLTALENAVAVDAKAGGVEAETAMFEADAPRPSLAVADPVFAESAASRTPSPMRRPLMRLGMAAAAVAPAAAFAAAGSAGTTSPSLAAIVGIGVGVVVGAGAFNFVRFSVEPPPIGASVAVALAVAAAVGGIIAALLGAGHVVLGGAIGLAAVWMSLQLLVD